MDVFILIMNLLETRRFNFLFISSSSGQLLCPPIKLKPSKIIGLSNFYFVNTSPLIVLYLGLKILHNAGHYHFFLHFNVN
jgi:hypothetical protein